MERSRFPHLLARLLIGGALSAPFAAQAAGDCAALAQQVLPEATITTVESVPAGSFVTPPQISLPSKSLAVPAFCRIALTIAPSALTEVWLPETWNGRLEGWGNGGSTGVIMFDALAYAATAGYATVSSDLGHQSTGDDFSWANGRPDLVIDFGYRATHMMTVIAKQLATAYYGAAPTRAYFQGNSAGGRQALMEASRYPEDYDGIIAGTPAQNWTRLMAGAVHQSLAIMGDPALSGYPSAGQVNKLAQAVIASCDGLDGLSDGQITDPRACTYDPQALACSVNPGANCLSAAQVTAIRKLYAPLTNSAGQTLYPGAVRGSEFEWSCSFLGSAPYTGLTYLLSQSYFQHAVYELPAWDFRSFDADIDVPYSDQKLADTLSGTYNLDAFRARGGKLLVWHGWSDGLITPLATVDYREALLARYGTATLDGFFRLYMLPAVGHCGSYGPGNFDPQTAVQNWVEQGVAPQSLNAFQTNALGWVIRGRPVCPYPQKAVYNGNGGVNLPRNFSCQ